LVYVPIDCGLTICCDNVGPPLEDIGEEEEQAEDEEDADIGEEDEMADFIVDEEDEHGAPPKYIS
jgi:transcription elongation factor SPT6